MTPAQRIHAGGVYRRIGRLQVAGLLALLSALISLIYPTVLVLCIVTVVLWTAIALGDALKRLYISEDELRMTGYVGGPRRVTPVGVSCSYIRLDAQGRRGFDARFLQINDAQGGSIRVWVAGWGRRRGELFERLSNWLDSSDATVAPDARAVLARFAHR